MALADWHRRLVSRDDTMTGDQFSSCSRAPSEAFRSPMVFAGSSPITGPRLLRKRASSQDPFLRRHYQASTVLWPCPTPARPTMLATALAARPPTGSGLPRLPGPPLQRAVPLPRWIGRGAHIGCFPILRGLPQQTGGSAATKSLIQGRLRPHSRHGPLDRSAARGEQC